jgi:hypothetical protein
VTGAAMAAAATGCVLEESAMPALRPMPALMVLLVLTVQVSARDLDGRYANSPLKQWFETLASKKGLCCSDADGTALSEVDWESRDGHYRVWLDGAWHDVPDDAVITVPNRAGKTMVWPMRGVLGLTIRCFMPGPMI